MKKIIQSLLCLVMLLTNFNLTSIQAVDNPSTKSTDDISMLEYEIENGEVIITDCDETVSGNLSIPNTIDGYPVVSIGKSAFEKCTSLVSIDLPDGLKSIDSDAFFGCINLVSVNLPNGLINLGNDVFYECKSLVNITIPKGVTKLGWGLFYECHSLKSVILPEELTSIGAYAFLGCSNLTSLKIPENVTSIGYLAFSHCSSLTTLELPNRLTEIESQTFLNCSSLISIKLPSALKSIEEYAFDGCESLTSIELPNGLINIGDGVFNDSIILGCYKDSYALDYAIENSKPYYLVDGTDKENTVSGTRGPMDWSLNKKTGVLNIKCNGDMPEFNNNPRPWNSFKYNILIVNIKSGCTSISNGSFSSCVNLKDINMPDTLNSIGYEAFAECLNLKNISIPNSVEILESSAFFTCQGLESIDLSNTKIKTIKNDTFIYCNNLNTVQLPKNLKVIERNAFTSNSLKSITFPETLTTISSYSFANNDLKEVNLPYSVESVGSYAFSWNNDLTKITFNNPECTIYDDFMFSNPNVKIYGHKGSTAEAFAKNNGYSFVELQSIDASNFTVKTKYSSMTYTGTARKPAVTVTDTNGNVVNSGNYTVSYSNNINVGTAKVTVTFKNGYTGTITKTFKITAKDASEYNAKLSYTKTTYSGSKKSPSVKVTDANGKELVKDQDYTIKYSSSTRTNVGRYSVTITYKGNYKGEKKLWYTVLPKVPANAIAELYGYDDVQFSWEKSTGASGYDVYYKLTTDDNYKYAGETTKLTYKVANLSDGVNYIFKVVPFYKTSSGTKYTGLKSNVDTVFTLKKLSTPKVTKSSTTKVKVSFNNIYGETGYQVSRSTSSTGTNIVSTIVSAGATNRIISATKGKTYYYKVRAYITREDGTKVYGPWSTAVKYVLK